MATDKYVVNVEAAVLVRGRYLMIVRGAEESHAPGALSLPGGKVEGTGSLDDVLEAALRREILEELGMEVHPDVEYVESKLFVADDGEPVVDVVFLCRHTGGRPTASDAGEVAAVLYMSAEEVLASPRTLPWTRRSIELAEKKREARGW